MKDVFSHCLVIKVFALSCLHSGLTQHDHARKVCGAVLQAVLGDQNKESLTTQFGRTKIFLLENQVWKSLVLIRCGKEIMSGAH